MIRSNKVCNIIATGSVIRAPRKQTLKVAILDTLHYGSKNLGVLKIIFGKGNVGKIILYFNLLENKKNIFHLKSLAIFVLSEIYQLKYYL